MTGVKVAVWIDFDKDGFAGADDVTAYYKFCSIDIGLTDPLGGVAEQGRCSLIMNNADRRFSPLYSSGAYYGKLLPNLPVKITVTDGVTTWTAFRGVTRDFIPQSGQYGPLTCNIECGDLLSVLADTKLSLPLQTDKTTDYLLKLITSLVFRSAKASGNIIFSGLPSANDTVTVNGVVYTFKSSLAAANEVLIGSTVEATIDNLVNAINGGPGAGTVYGTSTTRPDGCNAAPRMTYYREVQKSTPTRYYRLGEAAGTNADDVGTNSSDGTYVNTPTLGTTGALAGDSDTAVTLDPASTECVTIPTLAHADRAFTWEAWIKPSNTTPPAIGTIMAAYSSLSAGGYLWWLIRSNGAMELGFNPDSTATAAGAVSLGAWHHVVAVYSYVTGNSYLYVDGVSAASDSSGPFTGTDPAIAAGGHPSGFFDYYEGDIDEIAIYLSELSAADVARHYAARTITRGVTISANARGSWGNAITLAESGANITVSAATLENGADGPAGLYSFSAGRTISLAGDRWSADTTRALSAVEEIAETERGLFWAARDGTLTFKNSEYLFTRPAATAALTISSEHNAVQGGQTTDQIFNRVSVDYRPQSTLSSGIIAKANGVIEVPGTWGEDRANPADDLPSGGQVVMKLQYVDPGTGQFSGAESLILPLVPNTDFTVNEAEDGTGFDYTTNANIKINAAINGSDIEVSFRNTALGKLYVRNLQVRGTGIIAYDPMTVTQDDSDSQDAYGRRMLNISMPLAVESAQALAQSVGAYVLSRYATPRHRITGLEFNSQSVVNGVNLFSLEIGDVIVISDYQTGITTQRYMIQGMQMRFSTGDPVESKLHFSLRRLDDVVYWILGDNVYGVLDSTTRLGL